MKLLMIFVSSMVGNKLIRLSEKTLKRAIEPKKDLLISTSILVRLLLKKRARVRSHEVREHQVYHAF